jgi:hypothetical protein
LFLYHSYPFLLQDKEAHTRQNPSREKIGGAQQVQNRTAMPSKINDWKANTFYGRGACSENEANAGRACFEAAVAPNSNWKRFSTIAFIKKTSLKKACLFS